MYKIVNRVVPGKLNASDIISVMSIGYVKVQHVSPRVTDGLVYVTIIPLDSGLKPSTLAIKATREVVVYEQI